MELYTGDKVDAFTFIASGIEHRPPTLGEHNSVYRSASPEVRCWSTQRAGCTQQNIRCIASTKMQRSHILPLANLPCCAYIPALAGATTSFSPGPATV
jgi:hypothetical protein